MRIVEGRTDRIVVVGAGLSGLAAALHLTAAGRTVTVLEREDCPGGRVGTYRGPDYEIDSGATVLTLPALIDEALAAVGSDRAAHDLRIVPVDPAYQARFADDSVIRVYSDPGTMSAEVRRTCGAERARRYLRLRSWLENVYTAAYDQFMDANFDSPVDLVRRPAARAALADLVRLGAFGRLGPRVNRILDDPKLARLFTFQALYAGTAPAQALAVYGAIPHMDTSLGVYFPIGGMRAIAAALAGALTAAGGRLELNREVTGVEYDDNRATGVRTGDGRVIECDAVILTADIGSLDRFGIRRRRPVRAAPSAVVAHGTIPAEIAARWPLQAHHTIDFGQ
ncbi:MAG: phytoene desaturase, partial [Nocardia sp.]|nr:phytoene desaturase [Nocardia sp.]